MKNVLIFGILGLVAYMVLKGGSNLVPGLSATPTQNPAGGRQNVAPQSDVAAISGAVSSIFDAIGNFAQTNQSTT
jgi:Flp pilus assembly pilin Flp